MDHYIDIKVLPDLEAGASFLMNNVCSKLHAVLGQTTLGAVGVSFPDYKESVFGLGCILRLHGTAEKLKLLMAQPWLKGVRDYCRVGDVCPVPPGAKQRYFARRQAKSAHNRRQRDIKTGRLSVEEAFARYRDEDSPKLKLPYLQLTSRSNNQHVRLFIEPGPVVQEVTLGGFNSYGLSRLSEKTTVPWF